MPDRCCRCPDDFWRHPEDTQLSTAEFLRLSAGTPGRDEAVGGTELLKILQTILPYVLGARSDSSPPYLPPG